MAHSHGTNWVLMRYLTTNVVCVSVCVGPLCENIEWTFCQERNHAMQRRCYIPLHFVFSKWKPGSSKPVNTSNGFSLRSIFLFIPLFSLCLLLLFHGCILPDGIVPEKHFLDLSFVWSYFFCEIVLGAARGAFWLNMKKENQVFNFLIQCVLIIQLLQCTVYWLHICVCVCVFGRGGGGQRSDSDETSEWKPRE